MRIPNFMIEMKYLKIIESSHNFMGKSV